MSTPEPEPVERLAVVIPFPRVKTCWTCKHAEFWDDEDGSNYGTYCGMFSEGIDNEVIAAQDCIPYEFSEEAT